NPTVTGRVTDNLSGVAKLEAAVDGGSYQTVPFDAQGNFSFTTSLPADGTADGPHTIHLRGADQVGNVSTVQDVSFVLQTGVLLKEGSKFDTALRQSITIPVQPSTLTIRYDALSFDTTS